MTPAGYAYGSLPAPLTAWRLLLVGAAVFLLLVFSQAWVFPLMGEQASAAEGGLIRVLLGLIDGTPWDEIGRVNIPNAIPMTRTVGPETWTDILRSLHPQSAN